MPRGWWIAMGVVWAALLGCTVPAGADTADEVESAIERMRRFLYARQNAETGSWETRERSSSEHFGHTTGLVAYALLETGEPAQSPVMQRALEFLSGLDGGDAYTIYPRALCWARLPRRYVSRLKADARPLLARSRDGRFFENHRVEDTQDVRFALYGLLVLNAWVDRGGEVSVKLWEQAASHLVRAQGRDGGWSFRDERSASTEPPATVAAMAALQLCKLRLADFRGAVRTIERALSEGEAYLDERFSIEPFATQEGKRRSFDARFHDLFLLERMTRFGGRRRYRDVDWFDQGIERILAAERGRGSIDGDLVETAFALLVLAQNRAGVWISKLDLAGSGPSERPGDLHAMSLALTGWCESEIRWQRLSVDDPLATWLTAPLLYLSSFEAVTFTGPQRDRLKRYLQLGGTLVCNPERNSQDFVRSVHALIEAINPSWRFSEVPGDHPLRRLLLALPDARLSRVRHGVRDVVILAERDLALPGTGDPAAVPEEARAFWYNLYALACDRGRLPPRTHRPLRALAEREAIAKLTLGRLQYHGAWDLEPLAFRAFALDAFNRFGIRIEPRPVELSQLEAALGMPLVHWSGLAEHTLAESELEAVETYVGGGGLVVLETVNGHGAFARSVAKQLAEHWDTHPRRLKPTDRLLRSPRYPDVPDVVWRGVYRRYSVFQYGFGPGPELRVIEYKGRPAVVVTDADLTLGLLGVRHWGIHGYRPEVAKRIMLNLLLQSAETSAAALSRESRSELADVQ